jgi:RNA polymerase sigma-70 factor (ECF subfamily)
VTSEVVRVTPGAAVAVVELVLHNPTDEPLHCPPAVTQVHYHDGERTHRMVSHYSRRR